MPILQPITPVVLTNQEQFLVSDLLAMIGMFQRLEVFDELGIPDPDLKTIRFAYQNWRGDISIQVRKRTTSIIPVVGLVLGVDYTVDLANGIVVLTTPMNPGDEVRASYYFKYFADTDFKSFLKFALYEANAKNPTTAFFLESVPLEWNAVLILGAYVHCLQRLLLDQGIWSRGLIWKDADKWVVYLQGMLNKAEEMWKYWLHKIKRRGFIQVYGISSGKFGTQLQVNETNFRQFTLLGG
jgi:hypothetical protein